MFSKTKLFSALIGVPRPEPPCLGSGDMWDMFDMSPIFVMGLNSLSLAGKLNVLLALCAFIHVHNLFCVHFYASLFWKFSCYNNISLDTTSSALSYEFICSSTMDASSYTPIVFFSACTFILSDCSLWAFMRSFWLLCLIDPPRTQSTGCGIGASWLNTAITCGLTRMF